MKTIILYARFAIFVLGVLIGLQLPMYVDQYGKRLDAHYIEAGHAIRAFQQDADKFFSGDIDALVSHYRDSGDEIFSEGGESIETIHQRYLTLQQAHEQFALSRLDAYQQAFIYPLADIRAEVLEHYSYAVLLTPSAIVIGLMAGVALALLFELSVGTLTFLWRLLSFGNISRGAARPHRRMS